MPSNFFRLTVHGFIAVLLFSSCHNFYKVASAPKPDFREVKAKLDSLSTTQRYLILRNGPSNAYHITSIQPAGDEKEVTLLLESLNAAHKHHLAEGPRSNKKYHKSKANEKEVVNEAHVYIANDPGAKIGSYTMKLENVQRIEILQHDSKRTTNSYVLGGLGYTAGAVILALIVALSQARWH